MNTAHETNTVPVYAPHNGARVLPLAERIDGVPVARSRYDAAHAEPTEPVARIGRFGRCSTGAESFFGVVVEVETAVECSPWEGSTEPGRRCVHREVVRGVERWDATARPRLGLYGAIVTDEPSEGDVMAAVRRGIAALRGGVS